MTFGSIARGRQVSAKAGATLPVLSRAAFAILALAGLAACTTVEGTNALVDASTFEREVMSETLRGIGMLEREQKADVTSPRAPLVLPRNANALPAPQTQTAAAQLPEDSRNVQIDTSRISEEDLRRLRNARVITDPRSMSGRPLTEQETRMLTARMQAAQVRQTNRPLYIPPDSYFTTVKGQELVCMSKSGELVPLADPSCPPEIRAALAGQ